MPNLDYENEYRQWLSGHVSPEDFVLDTITIYGESIGTNRFVRYAIPLDAGLEDGGGTVTYQPAMFEIELPDTQSGTRQEMSVRFPSLEGDIYRRVKSLGKFSRDIPIFLTHRVYISTDYSKPMINPPVDLQVIRVGAAREQLVVELSVPQWTNKQAGRYYDIENYPGLFNV